MMAPPRRSSAMPLSTRLVFPLATLFAVAVGASGCGSDGGTQGEEDLSTPRDGGSGVDLTLPGDGGSTKMGPKITMCPGANLPALQQGVCKVEAGSDDK